MSDSEEFTITQKKFRIRRDKKIIIKTKPDDDEQKIEKIAKKKQEECETYLRVV